MVEIRKAWAIDRELDNRAGMRELDEENQQLFFNRENSWLAFNERVLAEAYNRKLPLLERLRFVGIASNNLDEFAMKRVGGLHRQLGAGVVSTSADGKLPREQLMDIRERIERFNHLQREILLGEILPELRKIDVHLARWEELDEAQQNKLRAVFEKEIFPILTPLGVGPGQPFPFISNLSLSLAVKVKAPNQARTRFARVKIPTNRSRWVQIPGEHTYVSLEDLIARHIDQLFIGMEIIEAVAFRVTRNADVERNEEEAEDLLDAIEEELRNRKFAPIVRLEIDEAASPEMVAWLVREMAVKADTDVYATDCPLGLRDLMSLAGRIDMPEHEYEKFSAVSPPSVRKLEDEGGPKDIFEIVRRGDLLVHHPFESFGKSVLLLLEAAATDPKVLAIKQTLYRTAENSPIVAALLKAAEGGKEVNVTIEIKARFDEAANIEWVKTLEKAGAHVTYGFVGLKTHCKTLLIVRDEPDGIRRYAHIGTGNYHTGTARLYTDVGLITCDPVLCRDVADLYNYLTGHSNFTRYKKLLVAPVNMRQRFIEMIEREIKKSTRTNPGHIIAKMNQLEDPEIIETLYKASQAGVKIELIIRGFNLLRPGVKGLSENISICSIIGRYLEHSRIFYFKNGGKPEYYIGSADWMSRNLSYRVEAVTPIESPDLQKELEFILKANLSDRRQSWELLPDGTYQRRRPRRGKGSQQVMMDRVQRRSRRA